MILLKFHEILLKLLGDSIKLALWPGFYQRFMRTYQSYMGFDHNFIGFY